MYSAFWSAVAEFSLVEVPEQRYFSQKLLPEWIENGSPELAKTCGLFPHQLSGEGHFAAGFPQTV